VTTTITRADALPAELQTPGLTEAASQALADWREDPDWVRDLRRQGWRAWEDIPWPTNTTEGWRRANLRALPSLDRLAPAAEVGNRVYQVSELSADLLDQVQTSFEQGGLIVQRDGHTAYGSILNDLRDQGVIFTDIHSALREHEDLVREHFMKLVPARWLPGMPSNAGKFEALNATFFGGGSFVYVPPDTTVTLPISFVCSSTALHAGFFPRSLIIVDRGSRLTYLDDYRSTSTEAGTAFGSGVVEVFVKDGARIDYVTIQEWSPSTAGFLTQRATLGADSFVNWVIVTLGGSYTRGVADVVLTGKGGRAEMLGLAFGEKNQVFDIHTYQDHQSPYTETDQLYKTAMRDRARLAYEGLINIRPGSYGSLGFQANKNLLLDDTAKADSIPMLEISDNDVRCTHSSSVGPIEEEHVYYLMTRGLDRITAERILIQGFFAPVVDRIAVEEVKEWLRGRVDHKIGQR
jgi:Fe-S cluster assembly protein SufD